MYKLFIKRFLDIIISLIAIIVFSLPMIITALFIYSDDKSAVIFRQQRVGRNKKLFWLYKFRTMRHDTPDTPTYLLENPEQYLLKCGAFIRRWSLDELPQLFNILKGDMSCIGPRPAQWNDYDMIELREKANVNSIRPGLSGWAQINGRDTLSIEEKAQYDAEYLSRESFSFDVRIFFVTIEKTLRGTDIVEGGTGSLNSDEDRKK